MRESSTDTHLLAGKILLDPVGSSGAIVSDGLGLRIHTYDAQGYHRPHRHTIEQAYYILKGHGKITVGSQTFLVGKDSFVYIPRGSIHSTENIGHGALVLLLVSGATESKFPYARSGVSELVGKSMFLMNRSGSAIALDETGSVIWALMDGSMTSSEIIDLATQRVGVSRDFICSEFANLVVELLRKGFLQRGPFGWENGIINDDEYVRWGRDIIWKEIKEFLIVAREASNEIRMLPRALGTVWNLCNGQKRVREIVDEVARNCTREIRPYLAKNVPNLVVADRESWVSVARLFLRFLKASRFVEVIERPTRETRHDPGREMQLGRDHDPVAL